MKSILFILLLSLSFSNFSYQSLLLPNSTYDLVSGHSQYSIFNKFLSNKKNKTEASSSIIILPQDIQMTSIDYLSLPFDYYNYFSINIIDYGEFTDSETNTHFDAKDMIVRNHLIKKINNKLYGLIGFNYLNSHIEDYSSSALCVQSSLFMKYKNFLFHAGVNNYGLIINDYTSYNESLPTYYSIFIMYVPKYLDSIVSINHNSFNNYAITNLFGELFIKNNYSITAGYTSIAKKLYYEDFNSNFFTGFSLGFNITYQDYIFSIGLKNLGSTGLINSFTFSKSFN